MEYERVHSLSLDGPLHYVTWDAFVLHAWYEARDVHSHAHQIMKCCIGYDADRCHTKFPHIVTHTVAVQTPAGVPQGGPGNL